MVSAKVLKMAKVLIQQNEAGSLPHNDLAMNILKLQRLTALSRPVPSADDVADVRDALEVHADTSARHIIEGVSARVMDGIEIKGNNVQKEKKEVTRYLDALVEHMSESEGDLIDQTAGCIVKNDCIMVVPQRKSESDGASSDDGNIIEKALIEAADVICELSQPPDAVTAATAEATQEGDKVRKKKKTGGADGNNTTNDGCTGEEPVIKVLVVRVHPDDSNEEDGVIGSADQMAQRLQKCRGIEAVVVDDYLIGCYMRRCTKVIIYAWMLDIYDGIGCSRGSAMMVSVANRMRVGAIAVCSKFRMMPMGSRCVQGMGMAQRFPGKVWEYEEARDDELRESVNIVAPLIDVVATQKVDVIVTEGGGYAPDYVMRIIPSHERQAVNDDDEGAADAEELEDENVGARGPVDEAAL